ncbi:MAG: Uma2 family endonuclease, partial [Chloroherpetonaceae bacterium]|nr:Uma2 family endonuclease [Chloroherpetonaceae bacterium]
MNDAAMLTENRLVIAFPDAMNADAFYRFSRANPNLRMELNSNGEVEIMAGTGGKTGIIESEINGQLRDWNRRSGLGKAFSPSTGFRLKNGSVRLSDGAWMRLDRWNALSPDDQERFP